MDKIEWAKKIVKAWEAGRLGKSKHNFIVYKKAKKLLEKGGVR